MILKDKKFLITGILTDKSIAYASAKIAIENGATVVATGFGKGLRITERAVKRLSDDINVYSMDIEDQSEVDEAVKSIGNDVGSLDGILHAIAFSPTEAMGGNFLNTNIADAVKIIKEITGERPLGWYTGRTSENTRRLVVEEGGFLYDADDYNDDLPFWSKVNGVNHLVIPYTLDANDMRFATAQGFNSGDQFLSYLTDAFDVLYEESANTPRMMSIGLHCRLIGRPGRIKALEKFLDYVQQHKEIWLCRRIDIARHWVTSFPSTAEE